MYANETILTLKDPRDPDPESGEEFPYNRVRVVGESPISHSHKGDWTGGDARGVILVPLSNFGANLDEPFGKCRELYDVESIPERTVVRETVRIIDSSTAEAGETPEEVFARLAPGKPSEAGERVRTSPLGDPGGPVNSDGPLTTPRRSRKNAA
jgi:hypothetical protein